MITFTKRNLKLYFREKGNVFFSLLGVIVVIGLYVLFLGDVWVEDLEGFEYAREMMDNWVVAGILGIVSMTTTLGILGNMIRDKVDKMEKDFYIAPIKRTTIAGGYILSAYIVAVMMSIFALILGEAYIAMNGGALLGADQIIEVLGMILLTSLVNTSIMFMLVSFFKSMTAYSAASTIVGTLVGFLTGIYLPIGMYPSGVQWLVKVFPPSHAALIFKKIMMRGPMDEAFKGAPTEIVQNLKNYFGIVYKCGTYEVPWWISIVFMIIIGMICFAIATKNLSKKRA